MRDDKIGDLGERLEPGEGWPQQERFEKLVDAIGDEKDLLVRVLRVLRMAVAPESPFDEAAWGMVLQAAEAVVELEGKITKTSPGR